MERRTDVRVLQLIEAGVQAGCYWRKEGLAAHPDAKRGWARLALHRKAVGAALMDEMLAGAATQAAPHQ